MSKKLNKEENEKRIKENTKEMHRAHQRDPHTKYQAYCPKCLEWYDLSSNKHAGH